MKKSFFLIIFACLFISINLTAQETLVNTARNTVQIDGFRVLAPSYDIVNIGGRTNVIKIDGSASQYNIIEFPLASYRGRLITIHISADVMRTGAKKGMGFVVNNEPAYPSIAVTDGDPEPGTWSHISGSLTIIPTNNNPAIQLSKWEQHSSRNSFFYIDNLSITIETWDSTPATTLATVGETNGNARNIYVSVNRGSDSGNGTQARPFQKIAHAMHYARPGDTVLLDSGTYYERFRIPTGAAGRPITLTAMPGANAAITPTVKITPQWRAHTRNIFVADISEWADKIDTEFPQLFADGDSAPMAMVEARYPNMGPSMSQIMDYKRDVAQRGTNANTIVASSNIPSNIEGARLMVWPGRDFFAGWVSFSVPVRSVRGRTITLAYDVQGDELYSDVVNYTPTQGSPFFITGALALLDAPGEYFFDKQTNLLYFYPPYSGAPDSRSLSMRSKGDIAIYAGNTSNVIIKDITVFGGGINMTNVRNNVLENCRVFYSEHFYFSWWPPVSYTGSMIVSGSNNRITRCEFGYTAGSAICLNGDDNIFTNNFVHNTAYSGNLYGSFISQSARRLEVSHNTFSNTGYGHVVFRHVGGVFERNIIRNNYFENVNILLNDAGGGFYTYNTNGGNTEIFNNFVVVGNKGDNGTHKRVMMGLYIDDFSTNYTIRNNITVGGTYGIQSNNSPVNPDHTPNPIPNNIRILNNTIIGADYALGFMSHQLGNANYTGFTASNNLLVNIRSRDIFYTAQENGRPINFNGNLVNGLIPVTQNQQGRMTSSGNARGTVDAQFRSSGNTPNIGAIPRDGTLFAFGADWGRGREIAAASTSNSTNQASSTPAASQPTATGTLGVFSNWQTYKDNASSINVRTTNNENIGGQRFTTYTFTGTVAQNGYAGSFGTPNAATLRAMRAMSSFSFTVLGDGNTYRVSLQTSETNNIGGDHFGFSFPTTAGQTTTITIDLTSLTQSGFSGRQVQFVKNNIQALQFSPEAAGVFNLKVWDVRVSQ